MTAKKNFAILAALVLLPVLAGWFLLQSREREADSVTAESRQPAAPATATAGLEPAELAEPLQAEEPARSAITSEAVVSAAREETQELGWELADSQYVEGVVKLPEGTPQNERVVVMALSEELDRRRIHGDGGPADDAWEGKLGHPLWHSAEAAADGRFRLAFPPDAERGWIAVTGRYVYSTQAIRVDLPATGRPVSLAPELGAWISGRLHAPPDAPADLRDFEDTELVLEIDMTAAGMNPMAISTQALDREIEADPTGSFEFRAVPTRHALQLAAKPERFAAHHETNIRVEPGQHLELGFRLVYGGTIAGRVVDQDGAPVAEADVAVRRRGLEGRIIGALRETESAEDGSFALVAVAPGRVIVEAERDGFLDGRLELPSLLIDGGTIDGQELVLDRGHTVAGTVRFPDGDPAADASVRVAPDWSTAGPWGMGGMAGGRGRTDAEGRFAISGLTKGTYIVSADIDVEEGEHAGPWHAREVGYKTGGAELVLVLGEPIQLLGLVVDGAGAPIPAFEVAATLKGSGGMFGIGAETVDEEFESEDGSFVLDDLREGLWVVRVDADGYGAAEPVEVQLPAPGQETRFVLEPAAAIAGTVLDTANRPVRGAAVTLQLDMGEMIAAQIEERSKQAYTDEAGRFLLDDLDPGTVSVYARLEGFASSEATTVDLGPGETAEEVTLQLRLGGTIQGVLYGPDGDPAAGQMVSFQKMPAYNQQVLVTTEADGTFRREHLDPGKWQLVSMPDMLEASMAGATDPERDMGEMFRNMSIEIVDVVEGQVTEVVLGAPPENPVAMIGRVLHAGEPVAEAMVSLMPDGAEGGLSGLRFDTTDEDGRFEIDLESPGLYLVTVQTGISAGTQNSVEFQETVPEDTPEHEVTLHMPGGRVSGRVKGPGGKPLGGTRVSLNVEGGMKYGTFLGGHYTETYTDSEGSYEIPYLRPGTYSVGAGGVPMGGLFGGDTEGGRAIRSGITVGENESIEGVDFQLARPGNLTGLVKDAAGQPLSGASVFVRDEAGNLLERFSMITSDASGRFTYKGLAPGRYTVAVRTNSLAGLEGRAVEVREGETARIELALEPGTKVYVTVVDKTEADITGKVRISVVDPKGREVTGMMSMSDVMERIGGYSSDELFVGPLPPGDYKVTATTDDGRSATKPVSLSGQEERRVKVRLR